MFIFYLSPKTARFSFGLLISLFLVSIFLAFLGEGTGDDFGADSVLLWIRSHDPFLTFCESIMGDLKLANLSITVSRLSFSSLLPHNNWSFDFTGGGEFSSSTINRNEKIMRNGYHWNFLYLMVGLSTPKFNMITYFHFLLQCCFLHCTLIFVFAIWSYPFSKSFFCHFSSLSSFALPWNSITTWFIGTN